MDESFWVSHSDSRDRLVSAGIRLELHPKTGEVLALGWELDLARKSDLLLGGLEVAPHLGGGFVFWSRNRVFRADSFTGALSPVALRGALGLSAIRGARNGNEGVLVFGESGAAMLRKGSSSLEAPPKAALFDAVALDDKRALSVDFTGRVFSTANGGTTQTDETARVGLAQKTFVVEPGSVSLDTWQGRVPLQKDGTLGSVNGTELSSSHGRGFEPLWPGSRVDEREIWWIWRDLPPIQAAVIGGARLDPSHAVGLVPGGIGIVDLSTGQLSRAASDWPQPGLLCSTVATPEEPLFVCGWESYQGFGSYVLRLPKGDLPPVLEKAFSDDGFFVTDDEGALGFVGSCETKARYLDPNDPSRYEMSGEPQVAPRICVRRGPSDWVEHEIEVPDGLMLYGWAASRDGTATAVLGRSGSSGLPEPVGTDLGAFQTSGVRALRLPQEVGGFVPARPGWGPGTFYMGIGRGPQGPFVDRRYQMLPDGSMEAWFVASNAVDSGSTAQAGVVLHGSGRAAVYPLPPKTSMMIATGDFGLVASQDGALWETTDHGRSYRSAGALPVPFLSFSGFCSPLGCTMGSISRLGWGQGSATAMPALQTTAFEDEQPPESTQVPVRLACAPNGKPFLMDPQEGQEKLEEQRNGRFSWQTGYGGIVTLVRELEGALSGDEEDPNGIPQMMPQLPIELSKLPPEVLKLLPPDMLAQLAPKPATPTDKDPKKPPKNKPKSGPLRTHSLLFRRPFDPTGALARIDATGSELEEARRQTLVPLLGEEGEMALLFMTDKHELLVANGKTTTLPLFETRRYSPNDGPGPAGLLLGAERALIVGDLRRRIALEDHGPLPLRMPVLFGPERDGSSRKGMTLARSDNGKVGLLLWDGSPAAAVSVAELDTTSHVLLAPKPLAPWSTATAGDDPRCKKTNGYQALIAIEPAAWFGASDPALPTLFAGTQGAMLVRWGEERVCVDAIDMAVDRRADESSHEEANLVVRFSPSKSTKPGASLLASSARTPLTCRLEAAGRKEPRP